MGKSRIGAGRLWVALVLVFSATLVVGQRPASAADITAVKGSAFGYLLKVGLFGGPPATRPCTDPPTNSNCGPAPSVTLPTAGSASAVTATAATGSAASGPATFFSSGKLDVSTQGTTGPSGSVTSSATVQTLNTSQQEALTAVSVASTCSASTAALSGATTVVTGSLFTDSGLDANSDGDYVDPGEHAPVSITLPTSPTPNTTYPGHLHVNGVTETFEFVLNEQVTNSDGSLTVNAIHQKVFGPTALGDLFVGQVTCGVTPPPSPSGSTTSTVATTTTTGATTTTVPATTTTASTGGVGGGAFGYYTKVGLFGGAPGFRGPLPTVTLPAAGSATPITDTVATGDARYGPGVIFTSGPITVSTQGTPGPTGSVISSTNVKTLNTSTKEVIFATEATSTCKASESGGVSGSATFAAGKIRTSAPLAGGETFVDIPASPPPNTVIEGKLEDVGDTFKYVFNEQIVANGAITVNAAHQYLLGPTAVGELIIGQSRCATTATAFSTTTTAVAGSGGGAAAAAAPAGGLAKTGRTTGWLVALGLTLICGGLTATRLGRRRLRARADER